MCRHAGSHAQPGRIEGQRGARRQGVGSRRRGEGPSQAFLRIRFSSIPTTPLFDLVPSRLSSDARHAES